MRAPAVTCTRTPSHARVEVCDTIARGVVARDERIRIAALTQLLACCVDIAAHATPELTLTRFASTDGGLHWQHADATLTLDIALIRAHLSWTVELTGDDLRVPRRRITWFDPKSMPCRLPSLAERCVQDVHDLCWHAAEICRPGALSSSLLPPGTYGPSGEPWCAVHESALVRAHPYVRQATGTPALALEQREADHGQP